MAAALRVFLSRLNASPARLLPPWLPGPSPKLYDAAAASRLPYTRGVPPSPTLIPSVLRRMSRGGAAAAGLASGRHRACLSPLQVPSLLPVRHHGSTSTKGTEVEEALASPHDALRKLQHIDKSVGRMKRELWIMIILLPLPAYLFYRMVCLLMVEVGILEWRVEELEKP